ncbi:DUF2505 domain-containing protein [Propionibacterium australiense]|uniref:DUF2505 family protein n=1 Tax=Propionibacterium australiense TaxID=119981 RepID=A0A383S593_9ACTN|nr:DUF2505 domain-containing protein [Propionibacterium australiense]RLP11706.1 DUF2505 family protein [Propionibacterium australiense]RLP12219.1 DUF2505 family protein [Propionibacterium australiense]SYZ32446.1 START-like domain [Propionibacterium australiense]VEH90195.1 Protein of uncharacterised function (DUF2505) [Propionibacterium australiense]
MDLNVRHEYAASPDAVHAMLTSPEYFSQLGQLSGASVRLENQGNASSLTVQAKSPEQVKAMVGETISLSTRVLWERDGEGWKGVVETVKLKVPAQVSARAAVQPGGIGTTVEYFLAVSVTIPLLGKKVEQMAEPRIRAALDAQKRSGDAWLAERSG